MAAAVAVMAAATLPRASGADVLPRHAGRSLGALTRTEPNRPDPTRPDPTVSRGLQVSVDKGDVFSIDIVISTGEGKPKTSEKRTTVFKRDLE